MGIFNQLPLALAFLSNKAVKNSEFYLSYYLMMLVMIILSDCLLGGFQYEILMLDY